MENRAADALSRKGEDEVNSIEPIKLTLIFVLTLQMLDQIKELTVIDKKLLKIKV